jgi:integrase
MFRRGASYYVRIREQYGDRWVSLGSDRDKACKRLREMKAGFRPVGRLRVQEAAEKWLETYIATRRNEKGVELARRRAALHLVPFFKYKPLEAVMPDDLRRYRLHLEKKPISKQTVAHLLSDTRCFFRWCESEGLVFKAPVPRGLLPKIQERPPDALTPEEEQAVLSVPEPYAFIVRLGLATGMRWSELVRARASDIERGMLVVSNTKSGKLRRVPLPADLLEEIRFKIGPLVPISDSEGFAKQVRKYSGVERFHAHQMRHTFATRWVERGGNLAALQLALGHSSIIVTQRYARLTDEHVRAEAERISGNSVANSVAGTAR